MSKHSAAALIIDELRESPAYRLAGLVEMSRLEPAERSALRETHRGNAWPLLQQPELANLREIGPWLFGTKPDADLQGQSDFYSALGRTAGDALCGWIVSALPPARLAEHLSKAAVVEGPDDASYMLRYHTEHALPILHARHDLPGIAEWLAPIRSWWVALADPQHRAWRRLSGYDKPEHLHVPPIRIDQDCWDMLAGDPLLYRLADQLKAPLQAVGAKENCQSTRLGLVRQYLEQARQHGLTRQADLVDYVTLMALQGPALHNTPAWQQALSDALNHGRPLAEALQARTRQRTY